jgi:hypothetical protein
MLLKEMQQVLSIVWTNRKERERLLDQAPQASSGDKSKVSGVWSHLDVQKVDLYANLIRYGLMELMSSVYPACEKLLGEETFTQTVDKYISAMPPDHYRLNLVARRFPEYLLKHEHELNERYPFLFELTDYEWAELELLEHPADAEWLTYVAPSTVEKCQTSGPILNPVLLLRQYRFPIPQIVERLLEGADAQDLLLEQPACMAVFRDHRSNNTRFLQLEEVPMQLVKLLRQRECSYADLLKELVEQHPESNPVTFVSDLLTLIEELQSKGLLIGGKRIELEETS